MRKNKTDSFWMSYSDLSSGLMICFLLVLVAFVVASKKAESSLIVKNRDQKNTKQSAAIEIKNIVRKMNRGLSEFCPGVQAVKLNSQQLSIRFEFVNIVGAGWFANDKSDLNEDGRRCLKKIMPIWLYSLFSSDELKDKIQELSIEGHADTNGAFLYNMELSQRRAFEVLSYSIDPERGLDKKLYNRLLKTNLNWNDFKMLVEKNLTAKGRSYARPIMCSGSNNTDCRNGEIDMAKSRRVELRLYLKSEVDI